MEEKPNALSKKSLPNRPLRLWEYWSKGRWVHRPQNLPLTVTDNYGALRNIPKSSSKIPQYIESLPHPKLKEYVRGYLNYLEKQRIWDTPLSNSELKRWESLSAQRRYKERHKEEVQKIEKLLLKNKAVINELLNPDPSRKQIMKLFGVSYSPLFGLYSLTAYVLVRLLGKGPEVFNKLLTYIAGKQQRRFHLPWYLRDPIQTLNLPLSEDKRLMRYKDEFTHWGDHLTETIEGFSKKPVMIIKAIEDYLYTCVMNACKKTWRKEQRYISIETETLREEPRARKGLISESIESLIFNDPVDRIIAENYGESNSEIPVIVEERLGKRITKQGIQKRRKRRVDPLIKKSLEIRSLMVEDESRQGFKPDKAEGEEPLLRDIYQCRQCKKHFLTLYPLNHCRDHAGEKPFRT